MFFNNLDNVKSKWEKVTGIGFLVLYDRFSFTIIFRTIVSRNLTLAL